MDRVRVPLLVGMKTELGARKQIHGAFACRSVRGDETRIRTAASTICRNEKRKKKTKIVVRGWGKDGGVTHTMHDRSRMNINPRIPTMTGRSTSVFTDQADIASTKHEVP